MEWITAREAISILAGHCDGYEAEAEALRLGAATGAFTAKADRMIRHVRPGLNEEGYYETDTDWLVPFDVWGALEIGFARGLDHGHLKAHPDWRTTINLTGLRFEKEPLA